MGSSIKCVSQCAEDPYRDVSSDSQPNPVKEEEEEETSETEEASEEPLLFHDDAFKTVHSMTSFVSPASPSSSPKPNENEEYFQAISHTETPNQNSINIENLRDDPLSPELPSKKQVSFAAFPGQKLMEPDYQELLSLNYSTRSPGEGNQLKVHSNSNDSWKTPVDRPVSQKCFLKKRNSPLRPSHSPAACSDKVATLRNVPDCFMFYLFYL